jgi:hypothetical protein
MLRDAGLYPTDFSSDLAGCRLLLHGPDDTDSSGGSWATSSGLFDEKDAPPWDCWIAFIQQEVERPPEWDSCVVSWIPPSLFAIAEDGIWAAPMNCIKWADDTDLPITRLLRAEGYLS